MNDIVQILPAEGWYFVSEDEDDRIVIPVAVWVLRASGSVVGLVGECKQSAGPKSFDHELVEPPPVDGCYKHHSTLSKSERAVAGIA